MAVKKKKKATRKKTSKIVEQSNASNELIEKIKANPLIALIGIAIVVGIGIFIYSSQQDTQIALNKCINKNLNSESNSNISKELLISKCNEKFQNTISISKIKISTNDIYKDVRDENCIKNKLSDKEYKEYKKKRKLLTWGLYPECDNKVYNFTESILTNKSKYLVTEIGYLINNKKFKEKNLSINPNEGWWVKGKVDKITSVQGVKIKLK